MARYVDSIPVPPRVLTPQEQDRLLKVTGERAGGFRDHMIISMALGTGMREHEIAALNVGDILDQASRVRRHIRLKVFKRSSAKPAEQDVVFPPTLHAKLKKYLQWKQRRGESVDAAAPLFMSRKHNRISTRAMRAMFHKWQRRAGLETRYTFHCIRHSSCTNIQRQSGDIRLTQKFARHKSSKSTERYTHPSVEDLLAATKGIRC